MSDFSDFPVEPTENEIEEMLSHPAFFDYITKVEIPKQIVGELDTIHTLFLCSCGMLVENAKKTSYNLIVNDETGTGKDWVTEKTLEIWKKKKFNYSVITRRNEEGEEEIDHRESLAIVKRTRISERVFTYWHNPKFEPDWTWDGKVFYNEDIAESILNSDVFKVMASTGSSATILVNQYPVDIEIRGKPVMIVTTAAATPNPENLRRFTIVNLDGTTDQTAAIVKRQAEAATLGISLEYNEAVCDALAKLDMMKVRIPFAELLVDYFLGGIIMRTVFERFLDYIKASAALYQRQRQIDLDGFVLADWQDYEIARVALQKTISNQYMVPLTKDQKKLHAIIREMGDNFWTVSEIGGKVTFMSDKWLRINLDKLADMGLLVKDSEQREESRKKVMVYKPIPLNMITLPPIVEISHGMIGINRRIPATENLTNNPTIHTSTTYDKDMKYQAINTIDTIDSKETLESSKKDDNLRGFTKLRPDSSDRDEAKKKFGEDY